MHKISMSSSAALRADEHPSLSTTAAQVARRACDALADAGLTVSCAESLTGGLVADSFVSVPGASAVFHGGVVTYATCMKHKILGVDEQLLQQAGAVDPRVAEQMVRGSYKLFDTDCAIATTGVAGPTPQDGKPVGLVYIAACVHTNMCVKELHLSGSRENIRLSATIQGLELLCKLLEINTEE